jgi:hypothetical protein
MEDLMDPETVDQNYAQLQQQAQQTAAQIQGLAGKLQAAAAAGDPSAREWMLDLREIALGVQQEQGQVSLLLQSIHSMVNSHVQSMGQPGYQQPGYQQGYQQPGYQQGYQQQGPGGMLQQFLGGGFGRGLRDRRRPHQGDLLASRGPAARAGCCRRAGLLAPSRRLAGRTTAALRDGSLGFAGQPPRDPDRGAGQASR